MKTLHQIVQDHLTATTEYTAIKELAKQFKNVKPHKAQRYAEEAVRQPYVSDNLIDKLAPVLGIGIDELKQANAEGKRLQAAKAHHNACLKNGHYLYVVHEARRVGFMGAMAARKFYKASIPKGYETSLEKVTEYTKQHYKECGGCSPILGKIVGYTWSSGPTQQTYISV